MSKVVFIGFSSGNNPFFARPPHPLFANLVYTKKFFARCSMFAVFRFEDGTESKNLM
jgi:hypothetical protein